MIHFDDYPEFTPDYTPVEMAIKGIFGGCYFNEGFINGTDKNFYKNYVPAKFLHDLGYENRHDLLLKDKFDVNHNKFKVNCGMGYLDWMDRNWIKTFDPYGWYNWYINFYYGRRCEDDERQIKRWKSFKARHGGMLKSRCKPSEITKMKKTRQNLLHWAIDSTNLN